MNYKIILIATLFLVVAVYSAEQENKHETEVKEADSEDNELMNKEEDKEEDIMNFDEQQQRLEELEEGLQQLKKSWWGRRRRRRRRRRSANDTNTRFLGKKKSQ